MALGHHEQSRMIIWSRDYMLSRNSKSYGHRKSYGHQIWQGSGLKVIKLKVVKFILLKAIKFMCP